MVRGVHLSLRMEIVVDGDDGKRSRETGPSWHRVYSPRSRLTSARENSARWNTFTRPVFERGHKLTKNPSKATPIKNVYPPCRVFARSVPYAEPSASSRSNSPGAPYTGTLMTFVARLIGAGNERKRERERESERVGKKKRKGKKRRKEGKERKIRNERVKVRVGTRIA